MADEVLTETPEVSTPVTQEEVKPHVPHMIPDDRVKKMLEKARTEAREEGRRQMQEELQAQIQPQIGNLPNQPTGPMQAQIGGNQISELIQREIQNAMQSQNAAYQEQQKKLQEQQHLAERAQLDADFKRKMDEEIAKDPQASQDFSGLNMDAFPHVKYLLTLGTDNPAAVARDLAKRKAYLAGLQALAERDPKSAADELQQLSMSIKDRSNKVANAENIESVDVLPKINPSATAGVDNGKRSIRDWKKDPRFRF